ncbi:hypothetical protein PCC9214_01369 [Planktothrix tepida]|uniref:DUF928 domain-containing protein n=2 Tax=Planktothrix TaxID=54304 RepID=A0A1J1LGQ4_9CYAN|nr:MULTISPECIES: DUF928 domain-containing protein [Planktothrix]CAD5932339.1 hypothetical protein PCC9214_01369 [Planktothrix tepida]CAD5978359.1 hypothetical protein NO713_04387 [Planktothrix pseudagardhii]CUR31664.1 conserved exported hypothetical protein [Planktothrix tepida PCC 9214]
MFHNRLHQHWISLSLLTLVGGAFVPQLSVMAQPTRSEGIQISMAFEPPPGEGMPSRTAGGGSRGQTLAAIQTAPPLMALVPAFYSQTNRQETDIKGLTVAATPTFFFYVPAIPAKEAAFSLKDENNNDIYQTRLTLPNQPGILSIALPKDTPPLKIGQTYRWSFGVIYNDENAQEPKVVFVSGEVTRTEPDATLTAKLQQAKPLEQAKIYAENGIWFESLATLAQLRQNQPMDETLTKQWNELLQSVGLESIANQPFVNALEN